ncbi:MAG: DUF4845 domain-containing protein [Halioglobus sp.]|nr:DUF4845 domain-containing protein [Halioglobus sp.]
MMTRKHESGMSLLGTLCILFMLGFFAVCIIRMAPPYFEYLTVKSIISKIAMDANSSIETNATIRRKIANVFNSNQISQLAPKDVEVYRSKGKTYIDGNYEVRVPIVWRIDAVLMFDDLLYQVGDPEPPSKPATVAR